MAAAAAAVVAAVVAAARVVIMGSMTLLLHCDDYSAASHHLQLAAQHPPSLEVSTGWCNATGRRRPPDPRLTVYTPQLSIVAPISTTTAIPPSASALAPNSDHGTWWRGTWSLSPVWSTAVSCIYSPITTRNPRISSVITQPTHNIPPLPCRLHVQLLRGYVQYV